MVKVLGIALVVLFFGSLGMLGVFLLYFMHNEYKVAKKQSSDNEKVSDALNTNKEKKEKIHTGDPVKDFENSLELANEASKRG